MVTADHGNEPDALSEFTDGFADGRNGRSRQKNRTGVYRRAFNRGRQARDDAEMWAVKRTMREAKLGAVA